MLVLLLSTVWCVGGYSQTWEKVSLSDLTNEDVFVIVDVTNSVALQNKAVTSKPQGTNITVNSSGDKLLGTISDDLLWNVSKNSDGTYTFFPNGNKKIWLGSKNGKTDLSISTWTAKKFKEFSGTDYVGLLEQSTNRYIAYSNNSDFRCYAKSTVGTYKTVLAYFKKVESTKKLASLTISGTPNKTKYNVGDEFDPTGLVVTGTYDDNSTAPITDGITWTKNPATLAVGNTSCSVTATVNDVTSPAYNVTGLTVVKSIKPIVFDFTANPNVWGVTPLNINGTNGSNVIAGKKLVVERVVMTATNGNDNGTCIFKNNKGSVNLRVYIGGSITFTAPEGYNLSNITFDFDNTGTFSTDVQTWETPTWTGNAHTVTFTCKTSIQVNTATIKLVAATPVTPEVTSGTIEFKAVDNDLHYATFSSDKDVVFYKDLDVFGVSVAGGKISQNPLTKSIYNVTDATAGEDKDGAVEGYYVPANTGVLVVCLEKTAPYYFPKEEAQTVTLPALLANQLQPTPANGGVFTHEDGYKYYKLAYDNYTAKTGLGFYWGAENGGVFSVKAGTAYLAVPESEVNNAKGFAFDGETTGIENVNVAANQSKTIYNLNGQRVSNMSQAGLYIVNGKKVVIRK